MLHVNVFLENGRKFYDILALTTDRWFKWLNWPFLKTTEMDCFKSGRWSTLCYILEKLCSWRGWSVISNYNRIWSIGVIICTVWCIPFISTMFPWHLNFRKDCSVCHRKPRFFLKLYFLNVIVRFETLDL